MPRPSPIRSTSASSRGRASASTPSGALDGRIGTASASSRGRASASTALRALRDAAAVASRQAHEAEQVPRHGARLLPQRRVESRQAHEAEQVPRHCYRPPKAAALRALSKLTRQSKCLDNGPQLRQGRRSNSSSSRGRASASTHTPAHHADTRSLSANSRGRASASTSGMDYTQSARAPLGKLTRQSKCLDCVWCIAHYCSARSRGRASASTARRTRNVPADLSLIKLTRQSKCLDITVPMKPECWNGLVKLTRQSKCLDKRERRPETATCSLIKLTRQSKCLDMASSSGVSALQAVYQAHGAEQVPRRSCRDTFHARRPFSPFSKLTRQSKYLDGAALRAQLQKVDSASPRAHEAEQVPRPPRHRRGSRQHLRHPTHRYSRTRIRKASGARRNCETTERVSTYPDSKRGRLHSWRLGPEPALV